MADILIFKPRPTNPALTPPHNWLELADGPELESPAKVAGFLAGQAEEARGLAAEIQAMRRRIRETDPELFGGVL